MRTKVVRVTRDAYTAILVFKEYEVYCTDCVFKDNKACTSEFSHNIDKIRIKLGNMYDRMLLSACDIVELTSVTGRFSIVDIYEDMDMSIFIAKRIIKRYEDIFIRTEG